MEENPEMVNVADRDDSPTLTISRSSIRAARHHLAHAIRYPGEKLINPGVSIFFMQKVDLSGGTINKRVLPGRKGDAG